MLKKYNLLVLFGFSITSILRSSFAVIDEPPPPEAFQPLDAIPFQPTSVWLPAMLRRLDQIMGTEMKDDFDFLHVELDLDMSLFHATAVVTEQLTNGTRGINTITDCDRITGIISEYIAYYRPHVDELADIPGHECFTALRNAVLQIRRRLVREIRAADRRTAPPAGRGGGSTSVTLAGRGGSTSSNVPNSSGTGPIRTNTQSRNQQGSRSGPYGRPPQGRRG